MLFSYDAPAITEHLFPEDINAEHNPLTGEAASAREMFQDGGQAVSSGFKGMFASKYNQDVRKCEQMAAELQTEATSPQYRDYWYELQLKIENSTKKAIESIGVFLGSLRQRAMMPHKQPCRSPLNKNHDMATSETTAM